MAPKKPLPLFQKKTLLPASEMYKKVSSFKRDLNAFADLTDRQAERVARGVAFAVFESVQVGSAAPGGGAHPVTGSPGTPVDTGFARNSWWASFLPGDTTAAVLPQFRASKLNLAAPLAAAALAKFKPGRRLYIFNNCVYILPLEFGHSAQAPNGMVRLTLAAGQRLVEAVVAKVKATPA